MVHASPTTFASAATAAWMAAASVEAWPPFFCGVENHLSSRVTHHAMTSAACASMVIVE